MVIIRQFIRALIRKCRKITASTAFFLTTVIISTILVGSAMHFRTINVWQLKNIGDSILVKRIGRRPIILGAFHRLKKEQNVAGDFVVKKFFFFHSRLILLLVSIFIEPQSYDVGICLAVNLHLSCFCYYCRCLLVVLLLLSKLYMIKFFFCRFQSTKIGLKKTF